MGEAAIQVQRQRSKPGEAVIRFGDWRKRQPTVLIDARQWVTFGKPEHVTVVVSSRQDEMGPYNNPSCS
jgi:hypothetical protein